MQQSTIKIDVTLDKDRIPQNILWNADGSSAQEPQEAKAMMVAFWDG